jgi:MFS family permease
MDFSAKSNLLNLFIIKIANWLMLTMPIVVLFYQANGLSMHQIFMLQGIFSISMVGLEIPGGYLADILGRKKSILYGCILGFIAYSIYSFSFKFEFFIIAEIIRGFGQSLISGADSAMLYDTLLATAREKEYSKYEGRIISSGNFAEAAAGILGGLLAIISIRTPYYVQTFVALSAIPACLALKEPPLHYFRPKPGFKAVFKIIKFSIYDNPKLRLSIFFSSIIGASTLTMAWFAQPYFKSVNLPIGLYGIIWSILNLSVGISSMYAYKMEKKAGPVKTVFLFSFAICIIYFILGTISSLWAIGFLLIFYLARGLATPLLKNYINQITDSEVRATILSVRNSVIRLIFAVLGPLYGFITDIYSLSMAFMLAGTIYTSITIICFFYFAKDLRNLKVGKQ